MNCGMLDDLADHIWFEGATMCEHPVGLVAAHRCTVSIFFLKHLLDNCFSVLVARRGNIGSFLDTLKAEDFERTHRSRRFWIQRLALKAETLGDIRIGSH